MYYREERIDQLRQAHPYASQRVIERIMSIEWGDLPANIKFRYELMQQLSEEDYNNQFIKSRPQTNRKSKFKEDVKDEEETKVHEQVETIIHDSKRRDNLPNDSDILQKKDNNERNGQHDIQSDQIEGLLKNNQEDQSKIIKNDEKAKKNKKYQNESKKSQKPNNKDSIQDEKHIEQITIEKSEHNNKADSKDQDQLQQQQEKMMQKVNQKSLPSLMPNQDQEPKEEDEQIDHQEVVSYIDLFQIIETLISETSSKEIIQEKKYLKKELKRPQRQRGIKIEIKLIIALFDSVYNQMTRQLTYEIRKLYPEAEIECRPLAGNTGMFEVIYGKDPDSHQVWSKHVDGMLDESNMNDLMVRIKDIAENY